MVKLIITADYALPEGDRVSLEIDKNNQTRAEELFLDSLEAKNDIQKMFFGLSVQENEELQEYLKQRASGIKESELIRIWGLRKIAEMVSGSGCSKEMLLRRPNADGATRARDSRLIQTLDNIIVEPVQAVYYNELKTKFAAVA